jgi:arylsulfatase A-like enzyme
MLQLNRRKYLTIGSVGGLFLGDYLKLRAEEPQNIEAKAKSVIYIYLPGGYAHQETFDPKPNAPVEYRGPLASIKTNIPGIYFSQHLSETAKIADKITVIRSMGHNETAHERGTNNMFTGYRPSPSIQYPSLGSVVSQQLGIRNNLPPYVSVPSVPNEFAGAGYMSHSFSSFSLGGNPEDTNFKVRDLKLPDNITLQRFDKRKAMLDIVNKEFNAKQKSDKLDSLNSFYENAFDLMNSNKAIEAFELDKEDEKTKETYGKNAAGMRLLLSRRLVEAGVRFITVTYGGWDHHDSIANNINNQLPPFDKAFSALINDLDSRGLLDSTLVCIATEFGRTPKINPTAGRDHWPKVFSTVMAGGGVKKGMIYGSSNETASEPADNMVSIEDWASTIYHLLGINYDSHLLAPGNRPVKIVDGGKHIEDILI